MNFILRPAVQEDSWRIRWLVWRSGINPTDLDWRRFTVAVDSTGSLIGCGQIKLHPDGSHELASIAVERRWRAKGVASAIIQRLLQRHQGSLYLMCRSPLGPFYHRFDFRSIEEAQMPAYFRKISRLVRWLNRFRPGRQGLMVMKRPGSLASN
jgi:N-acetylglutamate synthase-like GNAT family acetyltransferase